MAIPQLEQRGKTRETLPSAVSGKMHNKKKILILGELGIFSRRISAALSRSPDIECIIGMNDARRGKRFMQENGGAMITVLNDVHSVRRSLEGVFAVINTRGPFLDQDYTVPELCAELGVHYVDPADSRDYVHGISGLTRQAEKSGSLIVTGAATTPAVSALLVDMLVPEFERIHVIHTCLVLGKRDCRELAMARTVLGYSCTPVRMKEKGHWQKFDGWARPQLVDFPAPMGRRRSYLCDMLDLDIFPKRYGAQTVTFRTALPSRAANLVLSSCRWLKHRGVIQNLPPPAASLLRTISFLPSFGNLNGGLAVEVRGVKEGKRLTRSVFLVARDGNGSAIAAAPCIALIKKWAREGVTTAGAMPCVGLLDWPEVRNELLEYDIVLIRA